MECVLDEIHELLLVFENRQQIDDDDKDSCEELRHKIRQAITEVSALGIVVKLLATNAPFYCR